MLLEDDFEDETPLLETLLFKIDSLQSDMDKIKKTLSFDSTHRFNDMQRKLSDLSQQMADNMKALNTMMLQIKGLLVQCSTVRGKKTSDWYGTELPANPVGLPQGTQRIEFM